MKGETTDEALQEQCFLWERGAPVGLDYLTIKTIYMLKILEEREKKNSKSKMGLILIAKPGAIPQ